MRDHFFTIITATCNASDMLPRLLESLRIQTFRKFELIIQDGTSKDDTVAVVESYRDKLPALSLASEPDTGIYDAWNKATIRARGEWVLFLGADDELAGSTVLEQCYSTLAGLPETALYAGGGIDLVDRGGNVLTHVPYMPTGAEKRMRGGMPFPHPGLWHRRTLFGTTSFDTSLRIAADYDFVCRTWINTNGASIIPITITRMRRGGISDSPQHALRVRWESARVAARYFSGSWTFSVYIKLLKGCLLWGLCKTVSPQKAPKVLDTLRRLRGLPPGWSEL